MAIEVFRRRPPRFAERFLGQLCGSSLPKVCGVAATLFVYNEAFAPWRSFSLRSTADIQGLHCPGTPCSGWPCEHHHSQYSCWRYLQRFAGTGHPLLTEHAFATQGPGDLYTFPAPSIRNPTPCRRQPRMRRRRFLLCSERRIFDLGPLQNVKSHPQNFVVVKVSYVGDTYGGLGWIPLKKDTCILSHFLVWGLLYLSTVMPRNLKEEQKWCQAILFSIPWWTKSNCLHTCLDPKAEICKPLASKFVGASKASALTKSCLGP